MKKAFFMVFFALSGFLCCAQGREIGVITTGMWIVDKICEWEPLLGRDSCYNLRDSSLIAFEKHSLPLPGYITSGCMCERNSGYIMDPVTAKYNYVVSSDRDCLWFLGQARGRFNLVIAAEHVDYLAHLTMQGDSAFTLEGNFEGTYTTKFYKRVPTPESFKNGGINYYPR